MGEIGQEGLTRVLCSSTKPAHLGGFNFSQPTTRYLSQGAQPTVRIFENIDGDVFIENAIAKDTGLFAGALADVLHIARPSLLGVPKIGPERWGVLCYTARES